MSQIVLRERTGRRDGSTLQRVVGSIADAVRSYTVGKISLKDPALAKLFGAGYQTAAGITITDENTYTFSAVYDAVNQSSGDFAKLPLNLLKKLQGGGSVHFDTSKTYWLLKYEANPDMSAFELKRTMQAHALTCKGAYAEIERDGAGRPVALWPLTPDRVDPFITKSTLPNGNYRTQLRYRIDGDNKFVINAADMIHIRGLGYDGYCAYPVIDRARQAIGIALAAERFQGAFFGNNSNFGGVLAATDADLDDDQAREIQDRIEAKHKGPDSAWRMLVLGAGFKYFRTGVTPAESQLNMTIDQQIDAVARFFNMPVHKLKKMDRATFNNIEQMGLEYYTGHQLTWITNWEQELNRKLIPSREIGIQYFKVNANATMRADIKTRFDAYAVLLDRGVICADDVLELEDMNPQPSGQGKLYLVQGAMVPKDKIAALADATIEGKKAPKPPAPTADPNADPTAPAGRTRIRLDQKWITFLRDWAETGMGYQLVTVKFTDGRTLTRATVFNQEWLEVPASFSDGIVEDLRVYEDSLVIALRRTEEAEAVASEARAAAQQEREARIVAETTGTATAEQLAAARESEQTASRLATELTALVAQMRAEADAEAIEQRTAAEAALAERAQSANDADAMRDAAIERATAADAAVAAAQTAAEAAERAAGELRQVVTTTTAERATADAVAAAARADVDRLEAERVALRAELDTATARATEADTALMEARARIAALESDATTVAGAAAADAETRVSADAERSARLQALETELVDMTAACATADRDLDEYRRRVTDLEAQVCGAGEQLAAVTTVMEQFRGTHEANLEPLRSAVGSLERELEEARTQLATRETTASDQAATITRLEGEVRAAQQLEADGVATVIAAHRDLVADITRRMVERETDHARRAQTTPKKLQDWLERFYDGHADLMRVALLPAIRVHLAFIRSTEDPHEAVRRLVESHVKQSLRELRAVVDGGADDYGTSVTALLYRWDTERVTLIADHLMQVELEYAGRAGTVASGPKKKGRVTTKRLHRDDRDNPTRITRITEEEES